MAADQYIKRRSYKFRFYPSVHQEAQLQKEFGAARWLWNWALDMRRKAWKRRKQNVTGYDVLKFLPILKNTTRYAWLKDAAAVQLIHKP